MNTLADMQHSHPHMTLYRVYIFLGWGGIIARSVESLMMVLLSASLSSLIPPSYVVLTILL